MPPTRTAVGPLARTLRSARQARGLSIVQLATMARVSPRLISELERGMRAHVSFDTAMRLLHLVDVAVTFAPEANPVEQAARKRAELRRKTWTGERSTLSAQAPPPPAPDAATRLASVARASRLAGGLQAAYPATKRRKDREDLRHLLEAPSTPPVSPHKPKRRRT